MPFNKLEQHIEPLFWFQVSVELIVGCSRLVKAAEDFAESIHAQHFSTQADVHLTKAARQDRRCGRPVHLLQRSTCGVPLAAPTGRLRCGSARRSVRGKQSAEAPDEAYGSSAAKSLFEPSALLLSTCYGSFWPATQLKRNKGLTPRSAEHDSCARPPRGHVYHKRLLGPRRSPSWRHRVVVGDDDQSRARVDRCVHRIGEQHRECLILLGRRITDDMKLDGSC